MSVPYRSNLLKVSSVSMSFVFSKSIAEGYSLTRCMEFLRNWEGLVFVLSSDLLCFMIPTVMSKVGLQRSLID